MTNPKQGNRILLLSLAMAIAATAIFVQWGVITITEKELHDSMTFNGQRVSGGAMGGMFDDVMSMMLVGMTVPVSGLSGSLVLGPLTIPYWVPVAAVIIGLLLTLTNSVRFSEVPRKLVFLLLIGGLVAGAWAVVGLMAGGTLGVGPLLLIGASVIGLTQQRPLRTTR